MELITASIKYFLETVTDETVGNITNEELNNLYDMLIKPVCDSPMVRASHGMYEEWLNEGIKKLYWLVDNELDNRYRKENEPKIREYFEKYFKGKTWDEIESNEELYELWDFYSDYHKDVFGYRPHGIVCGVYVSPY